MKKLLLVSIVSLVGIPLLGGCAKGDSSATAAEEETFKHPPKGVAPTASQLAESAKVPSHVGPASGSIPVGGSSSAGAAPPPGAMEPPKGG